MQAIYYRGQAEGAIPNGTPIVKVNTEQGDINPTGTKGIVLGSVPVDLPPNILERLSEAARQAKFFYFVEWESTPGVPVGIGDWKIKPL